jgi:Nitroreductase family
MTTWLSMVAVPPTTAYRSSVHENPRIAGLLNLVQEAVTGHGAGGARSVPSAGALFPYDILVVTGESANSSTLVLRVEPARGAFVRLPVTEEEAAELRSVLDKGSGIKSADHIVLMIRPWLSVRKYGSRGYLYSHLDAGHAAVNLLGTALGRGTAALRLRLSRDVVTLAMKSVLPFREVHSVVSVSLSGRSPGATSLSILEPQATSAADDSPLSGLHTELEGICWSRIPADLPEGGDTDGPVSLAPFVTTEGLPPGARIGPREWRRLSQLRRSSTRFLGCDIHPESIARAISVLVTELPTDLPGLHGDACELNVSVVAAPGPVSQACSEIINASNIRVVASSVIGDEEAVSRLCTGQRHVGGAQALVLFHVSRNRLHRPQELRDTLFRASAAAHLLYLGATRNEVGVTAVGAYDVDGLRATAGIGQDEEIVYLLAMGVAVEGSWKIDRDAPAHAHGE